MKKRAVFAIGGNSLIPDENHIGMEDQYRTVIHTCSQIASVIEMGYEVVITHGNGPQVGFNLLRSDLARQILPPVPLDFSDAETQGSIGYAIQRAMLNEFRKRAIEKDVATVITQVVVDPEDEAFINPTKPVGPFYTKKEAEKHRLSKGWAMLEDAGRGYRRVVPSPRPVRIVEISAIRKLVNDGITVIAAGGGGIPVVEKGDGTLQGVEAVIDKDFASSLLAKNIQAELLIVSTTVPYVYINFGTPDEKPLEATRIAEIERYLQEGHFKEGSMAPKIRAAISFLKSGGEEVIISSPDNILSAVKGSTGTRIRS